MKMAHNKGFTLMEVLVAVAVAGLVITAGFRLIAMSTRLMAEIQSERELVTAAQKIWLQFRLDPMMSESGKNNDEDITWKTERDSLQVAGYDLKFKRIIVTLHEKTSMTIYVADNN